MRNWLRKITAKNHDYVFLYKQQSILTDNDELLKQELHGYIDESIKPLKNNSIKYMENMTGVDLSLFTVATTFEPKTKKAFFPLLYEMYAYTKLEEERIFKDYEYEKKSFSDGNKEIELFRIKIK